MVGRLRELGWLGFAAAVVMTVCVVSYASVAPSRQLEDVAPVAEQGVRPAFNLALGDVPAPVTYVAAIEAFRWSDAKRHVLDMRIQSAQLVDVDARTGALRNAAAPSKADVAERIVGQRVLAVVEAAAASRVKTPGRSTVRLVVMPQAGTVQVAVRDIVDPVSALGTRPSARAAAASSLSVTALSTYAAAPGTQVTITGRGFGAAQNDGWVVVCGTKASVVSWSDTSIVFVVPAAAKRPGYVGAVVDGVTSNGVYFTPYASPRVTTLSPREGAPGTVVTIDGSGFGVTQGDGWVSFAGASGQVSSWSDNRIRVVVPKGVGTGYVGVVVHGLSSNGVLFSAYGCPAVESLSSSHVLAGDSLTINGRNFGASPGQLVLGGVPVTTASWSNTRITLTVATSARSGYIGVVRSGGLTSNGVFLRVAPKVTGLSSWWGAPGSELTISGRGFGATAGAYAVSVGGETAQVTSWSDTTVRVTVPASASSGYVGVGTPASFSNGIYFVVETRAHVDSVDDASVAPGDTISITGSGFGPARASSRVTVGGRQCEIVQWSDTEIRARIPDDAESGYAGVVKQGVASNGVWVSVAR